MPCSGEKSLTSCRFFAAKKRSTLRLPSRIDAGLIGDETDLAAGELFEGVAFEDVDAGEGGMLQRDDSLGSVGGGGICGRLRGAVDGNVAGPGLR